MLQTMVVVVMEDMEAVLGKLTLLLLSYTVIKYPDQSLVSSYHQNFSGKRTLLYFSTVQMCNLSVIIISSFRTASIQMKF